jgi:hypothetical protein
MKTTPIGSINNIAVNQFSSFLGFCVNSDRLQCSASFAVLLLFGCGFFVALSHLPYAMLCVVTVLCCVLQHCCLFPTSSQCYWLCCHHSLNFISIGTFYSHFPTDHVLLIPFALSNYLCGYSSMLCVAALPASSQHVLMVELAS